MNTIFGFKKFKFVDKLYIGPSGEDLGQSSRFPKIFFAVIFA